MTAAFLYGSATNALSCSRGKPFSYDELFAADLIVRATAEKYVSEPDLTLMTTGVPDVQIEFRIDEILKGKERLEAILLNGYLFEKDDYNDQKLPYTFVRKNGRSGSCFANTYKKGGSFLLFLKKTQTGYTPNISALGPTNEQLRGTDDAWLLWTRDEVEKREQS